MRVFAYAIAAAAIAIAGWQFTDPSLTKELLGRSTQGLTSALPKSLSTGQTTAPAAQAGIHKCKVGTEVIYTDAPCQKNHSEQEIKAGTVTVVKGQRPSIAPPSLPASIPNARALLGEPLQPSLMDREIERATR